MYTQNHDSQNVALPESAIPLMQRALGKQWHDLPEGLKQHYKQRADGSAYESGWLTISYPRWMRWPLKVLSYFGAMPDKAGVEIPTQVTKQMKGDIQHWTRLITYTDGTQTTFNSRMTYGGNDLLVEYVNRLLALRLRVSVHAGQLHYRSAGYLLQLGKWQLILPEWLALGYGYIEETALSADSFAMNFWLQHPLLGEVYRYRGEFRIH